MTERASFKPKEEPVETVHFIPSGCVLLDLVLGGGWAQGRVVNVVGDSSTGKTLLAMEACIQFALDHGIFNIRYNEPEAAFVASYAHSMGFPKGIKPLNDIDTVEGFDKDLTKFLATVPKNKGGLYILDSLDSLSDEAELKREIDEGTYGTGKAKMLGELFRRRVRLIEEADVCLFIISQVREKIGVMFGEKRYRSGGKALRFYASQELWLAEKGKIKRTVKGNDRVVGIDVRAQMKKNKVGKNYREVGLELIFDYGIDDENSMINFLEENKASNFNAKEMAKEIKGLRIDRDRNGIRELHAELKERTIELWEGIEDSLAPPMSKYEVD